MSFKTFPPSDRNTPPLKPSSMLYIINRDIMISEIHLNSRSWFAIYVQMTVNQLCKFASSTLMAHRDSFAVRPIKLPSGFRNNYFLLLAALAPETIGADSSDASPSSINSVSTIFLTACDLFSWSINMAFAKFFFVMHSVNGRWWKPVRFIIISWIIVMVFRALFCAIEIFRSEQS